MTLEETALVGAFTIVGTLGGVGIGYKLTTHESRRGRSERETKLKRLIVSEVAEGLGIIHIGNWMIEIAESVKPDEVSMRKAIRQLLDIPISTTIYDSIARDPTLVSPDVFEKFMHWHGASTMVTRARASWVIGAQVEKIVIPIHELVSSSTKMCEDVGLELLRALGATQEIKDFETTKKELDPILEAIAAWKQTHETRK